MPRLDDAISKLSSQPMVFFLTRENIIALICDDLGTIQWVNKPKRQYAFSETAKYLLSRNLLEFYHLPPGKSLSNLAGFTIDDLVRHFSVPDPNELDYYRFRMDFCYSRNVFESRFVEKNIVTDLPLSRLELFGLVPGFLLGIITLQTFLRISVPWDDEDISLILDDENRLRGYNATLLSHLGKEKPRFGESVERHLRIQSEPWPPPSRRDGEVLFEYTGQNLENNAPDRIRFEPRLITCAAGETLVLKLPAQIDLAQHDYDLEFEASGITQDPPICILNAGPLDGDTFPDIHGILFGVRHLRTSPPPPERVFLVKRQNEIASLFTEHPVAVPSPDFRLRYRVVKLGPRMGLEINGSAVGYCSITGLPSYPGHHGVAIGFRAGHSGRIHSIHLTRHAVSGAPIPPQEKTAWFHDDPRTLFGVRSHFFTGPGNAIFQYLRLENLGTRQRMADLLEQTRRQEEEILRLKRKLVLPRLTGESEPMQKLRRTLEIVARSDAPVMLIGETGVGKSFVAEQIHLNGPRAVGPFVKVDCSGLPPSLIEAELFGHERGAFTGAEQLRIGRFEAADGGTLFLDEIANLLPALQAKLLTVLQDRRITRIGGNRQIHLDIRIISATNADLASLTARGAFREDLYYRLNVLACSIPPLRDRKDDIPELCADFLLQEFAKRKADPPLLAPSALRKLQRHSWPGNIRELHNVLLKAVTFCDSRRLEADHIPIPEARPEALQTPPDPSTDKRRMRRLTLDQIKAAVVRCEGNMSWAAEELRMSRMGLYNRLKRAGLDPEEFRSRH